MEGKLIQRGCPLVMWSSCMLSAWLHTPLHYLLYIISLISWYLSLTVVRHICSVSCIVTYTRHALCSLCIVMHTPDRYITMLTVWWHTHDKHINMFTVWCPTPDTLINMLTWWCQIHQIDISLCIFMMTYTRHTFHYMLIFMMTYTKLTFHYVYCLVTYMYTRQTHYYVNCAVCKWSKR